jgi:hypothetical protein
VNLQERRPFLYGPGLASKEAILKSQSRLRGVVLTVSSRQ